MSAKDLVLNIAVNLGRITRWTAEGKSARVDQFLKETQEYLDRLESAPKDRRFQKTFDRFKKYFINAKEIDRRDDAWAEEMLTWANILTHRAKIA